MRAIQYSPLMFALALAACGGEEARKPTAASGAPVTVTTAAAAVQEWPSTYEATGTVRARTTAVISAKVMGYVQQVGAQVGDRVKQGQTLVTIDARDLDANVRRAEAGRSEVQSAIPEAESGMAAAKANLDLAQSTFKRMEELSARKSITSQEFDEASARLKGAQANHNMARAKRAQLDAKLAQVEQEIRAAGIMRDYAKLTAPFDGIVTAKSVETGSLAAPGAPLLTLEQDGGYRLEASVDESRLPGVKVGQAVEVALDTLDRKVTAKISEIVPAVDAASRSYIVKIDLPASPQLRGGAFGRAFFSMGTRKALTAPAAALVERGQLQSVFVAEGGVAHSRMVTVGDRVKDSMEILSGLSAGEKVVAPVPAGLADGARLEVR